MHVRAAARGAGRAGDPGSGHRPAGLSELSIMATPSFQLPSSMENRSASGRTRRSDSRALSLSRWELGVGSWEFVLALALAAASAQQEKPKIKPSQHGTVSQHIDDTAITVDYNRPVARGRELFGKLVPYGRIWCPGADDATTVEVSTAVTIRGQGIARQEVLGLDRARGRALDGYLQQERERLAHPLPGRARTRSACRSRRGPAAIWKRWRSTSRPWTAGKPSWRCIGGRWWCR